MQLETGIVAALLIAAILVYDRLGGNDELARRMFQVGLALSLAFVVLSATAAFIRIDTQGGLSILGATANTGPGSEAATDASNRLTVAMTVHYAAGVVFLLAGLAMLRTYHTIPLSFVLGGVLLIFVGGTGPDAYTQLVLRLALTSSQKVDGATFAVAVGGTVFLLSYGVRLEKDFEAGSDGDDDSEDDEGADAPA